MSGARHGASGTGPGASTCPACGTPTTTGRDPDPALGGLSLDEIETLARNEWRRRLGEDAYRRPHRRRFIRALLVYGLSPDSPVRRIVLEDALWDELAALEVRGLSRRGAEVELYALARALWWVLAKTHLPEERRIELVRQMDDRLRAELGWPAEEWESVRAIEGPLF